MERLVGLGGEGRVEGALRDILQSLQPARKLLVQDGPIQGRSGGN